MIFKIVHAEEWRAAEVLGVYRGSVKDEADGFLHFSTEEQLMGTLMRYYAGADNLILVAIDEEAPGNALRYEPSTAGAFYPHLYGDLPLSLVLWSRPIAREPAGAFVLPL
ncbi:MAG: DUF952 domain-containing protein [Rhizomicrobium sp.]